MNANAIVGLLGELYTTIDQLRNENAYQAHQLREAEANRITLEQRITELESPEDDSEEVPAP